MSKVKAEVTLEITFPDGGVLRICEEDAKAIYKKLAQVFDKPVTYQVPSGGWPYQPCDIRTIVDLRT